MSAEQAWVIVSTSERSVDNVVNIMRMVTEFVANNSHISVGFDWKSHIYPEDKLKWEKINAVMDDFFTVDGVVDEDILKAVEKDLLETKWWQNYRGQVQGRLKEVAARHPKVLAICIQGGPIARVEANKMSKVVRDIQAEYGNSTSVYIDVVEWTWNRFLKENAALKRQPSAMNQTLQSLHKDNGLPNHWTGREYPDGWKVVKLDDNDATIGDLQSFLDDDHPHYFGSGRDASSYGRRYNYLELKHVWRVENPARWTTMYKTSREKVKRDVKDPQIHPFSPITKFINKLSKHRPLPGETIFESLNETRLLYGTKPEVVVKILRNGMNERLTSTSGMFGFGTYLAEDPSKSDLYCTPDYKLCRDIDSTDANEQSIAMLHSKLYPDGAGHPNHKKEGRKEDLFYMLVCRTTMGIYDTTKRDRSVTDNKYVFNNDNKRELRAIPGDPMSTPYHALLVETGEAVFRHREIVIFNSACVYPEYLLAYQRKKR